MPVLEPERDAAVVVDANVASSVACVRSLASHGVRTVVASEAARPPAGRSRYCDETVRTPSPDADVDAYANALLALAERRDVRTVVPFRPADAYALSKHRDEFAPHVGTPWPPFDAFRLVHDRLALLDVARDAGVPVPDTALLDDVEDWSRGGVVKSRYTVHVEDGECRYAPVEYVAPGRPPDRDRLVEEMGHVPLVQEYLPDPDEYAVFALYDRGEPAVTFQHRQFRGWRYAGGPSAYRVSIDDPDLAELALALLDELEWHGLAMVEFKRDPRTGEYKLLEVNPRFWSSLPFTVQAGVDFPCCYWLQATGGGCVDASYDVGVGGHFLLGELMHLASVVRDDVPLAARPRLSAAVADVAASTLRHPRFDLLAADDPRPFARTVLNNLDKVRDGRCR